jgi:hypothetical protein
LPDRRHPGHIPEEGSAHYVDIFLIEILDIISQTIRSAVRRGFPQLAIGHAAADLSLKASILHALRAKLEKLLKIRSCF